MRRTSREVCVIVIEIHRLELLRVTHVTVAAVNLYGAKVARASARRCAVVKNFWLEEPFAMWDIAIS